MAQVDPCTASGLTPFVDSVSGVVLYCLDANGNAVQLPALSVAPSGQQQTTTVPASTSGSPSFLSTFTGVENDLLAGWRTVTQPTVAPGQVGGSIALGPGGASLSGSPVLLLALIAVLFFALERR